MAFELERIAELANLRLDNNEKQVVAEKMDGILKFVEGISQLDLAGHKSSVSSYDLPTIMREDIAGETATAEELAINVPKLDNSSIIVPQVIQK